MTDELEKVAKRMYTNYCNAVGSVAFNGDKLPSAEEFFADTTKQKQADAWRAVAKGESFWNAFPAGMK